MLSPINNIDSNNNINETHIIVYGFKGISADPTQRFGFICPLNIKKNNCISYLSMYSNINLIEFTYGIQLSYPEYLQINRTNVIYVSQFYDKLSDKLYSKVRSVNMLFDKCVDADLCFDKYPQIYFVDKLNYNHDVDNFLHHGHRAISHIEECPHCPHSSTEEYDQSDYFTDQDTGHRKKNINGVVKEYYLPARIVPIDTIQTINL